MTSRNDMKAIPIRRAMPIALLAAAIAAFAIIATPVDAHAASVSGNEQTFLSSANYNCRFKAIITYTVSQSDDKTTVKVTSKIDRIDSFKIAKNYWKAKLSGDITAYEKTITTETANGNSTVTLLSERTYTFTKTHEAQTKNINLAVTYIHGNQNKTSTAKLKVSVPAKKSYAVKYSGNGSTGGSTAAQVKWYGEKLTLRKNGFSRTGYTFKNWNTAAAGSGTSYSGGASYSANKATTLYAQWKANTYTVKYNKNGGTGGSTASSTHTYGVAKALTANGFTRTGYTFKGWNTKADGSGTAYANKASVKNLTATNGGTVTLYARWTANTYTVVYNGNGATSGSTAKSEHVYNQAKTLTPNGFQRDGYTFVGWNTKPNGSGTSYSDRQSVKNLTSKASATVQLYAIWKREGTAYFMNKFKHRSAACVTKVDAATGYPLEGAIFIIEPALPELGVPGELYGSDGTQVESLTITTGADGIARTDDDALSCEGLFRVREAGAPEGYEISDPEWRYFTSGSEEGEMVEVGTWEDEPMSVSIAVHARKNYRVQTGGDSTEPIQLAGGEFTFELLEGPDYADAQVISATTNEASEEGPSDVVFPAIDYTYADIGEHVYWIRETTTSPTDIEPDALPRKVVVSVRETDNTLLADAAYHEPGENPQDTGSSEAPLFTNTLHPSFDVRVYKHGASATDDDAPLAGAVFSIFEIPCLGFETAPAIPDLLTDISAFETVFAINEAGTEYDFSQSAEVLEANGITPVMTIATGRDGVATTEGAPLESGKAYAIIEVKAPAGYVLSDPRTEAESPVPVYIVDDFAPDGTYSHMSYQVGDEFIVVNKDSAGEEAPQEDASGGPFDETCIGYRVETGSSSIQADAQFDFQDKRDDTPRGGLGVRKVSAETGEPLAGATFLIYEENAFASAYETWKQAEGADADDVAFLDAISDVNTIDEASGEMVPNPYFVSPADTDLDQTDEEGYACTGDVNLPVGEYRVIEKEAPRGYRIADYDFSKQDGSSGNVRVEVAENTVTYASCEFSDPRCDPWRGEAPIKVDKELAGGSLSEGQFEFGLYDLSDETFEHPLAIARNTAGGSVDLATFSYVEAEGETFEITDCTGSIVRDGIATASDSWEFVIREIVPPDAECKIDGSIWTYAEFTASFGFEEASAYSWSLGGIVYDASLLPVEIDVDSEESVGEIAVHVRYPQGNTLENAQESNGLGGVRVMKAAAASGEDEALEPLDGAVFLISGTTEDGEAFQIEVESDDDGIAQTARDALPRGSYSVTEIVAPKGYRTNTDWHLDFEIADSGDFADFSLQEDDWCIDEEDSLPLPVTGQTGIIMPVVISLTAVLIGLLLRLRFRSRSPTVGRLANDL